jgi:hypothetical protein
LELISISKRKKLNMADGKIGVGATVGIVVGITAVLGLGLYFILRKKTSTSSAVPPVYVPPPTNNAELEALKTQLAILQQQRENAKGALKDETDAQIKGILIATGGKIATSFLDKWISGLGNKEKSIYLDSSLATTAPSGILYNPSGTIGKYDYLNPWSQTRYQ